MWYPNLQGTLTHHPGKGMSPFFHFSEKKIDASVFTHIYSLFSFMVPII